MNSILTKQILKRPVAYQKWLRACSSRNWPDETINSFTDDGCFHKDVKYSVIDNELYVSPYDRYVEFRHSASGLLSKL